MTPQQPKIDPEKKIVAALVGLYRASNAAHVPLDKHKEFEKLFMSGTESVKAMAEENLNLKKKIEELEKQLIPATT
jgi:hypothetical protein